LFAVQASKHVLFFVKQTFHAGRLRGCKAVARLRLIASALHPRSGCDAELERGRVEKQTSGLALLLDSLNARV
jgi:hypothetical protein